MNDKTLYQTVEDRNNPLEIESEGPFLCVRNNAWLGRDLSIIILLVWS